MRFLLRPFDYLQRYSGYNEVKINLNYWCSFIFEKQNELTLSEVTKKKLFSFQKDKILPSLVAKL